MFRITKNPSSGSLVQYLAKNYKNGSIMSVDMDVVGVMGAQTDPWCVCIYTRTTGQYSTVQYSTVRYGTVSYGTVRYSTVR